MIAFGMPGQHGENDEDSLDREQAGDGDDGGEGDLATEAICSIVRNLHEGGPSAVRDLRRFTSALDAVCEAYMARDHHGLEEAASEAVDVLNDMLTE
jgi:hypothetical protein